MADARYSREALALALARESAAKLKRTDGYPAGDYDTVRHLIQAVETLDNLGIFSAVDRQTDYTAAADILAANAADRPLASPTGLAFSQIRHPSGGDLNPRAPHETLGERYGAGPDVPPLTREQIKDANRGSAYGLQPGEAPAEWGTALPAARPDDTEDGRF
jgi:hypothetical protein